MAWPGANRSLGRFLGPPVWPPLPPELVNYPNPDHRLIGGQVALKSISSTRTLLCNSSIVMISANGAVVYPLRVLEYGSHRRPVRRGNGCDDRHVRCVTFGTVGVQSWVQAGDGTGGAVRVAEDEGVGL